MFLVALNGFFVAAEFSLVKVRKTRLAVLSEKGSKSASVALSVTSRLDAYLSACQLGITLASLGLGWLGEPAIATLLEPIFAGIAGWSPIYTHTIAIVTAFIIITFLHIVLGELVPKSLAIQRAEVTALWTAGFLNSFYKIFFPVIWALNWLANAILKLWGIHPANEADLAHSEEEIRMLVNASERHGYLDKMEGMLLDNVFEFFDRVAGEVMVPRQDMVCLYLEDSLDEIFETVQEYGHTRYPLCDDDKDNVIGMVHLRNLIRVRENRETLDINRLKRDILVVPVNMPISFLVQKMRSQRTHMAIVADEFGGTAGLVTIEDLIEELIGEIYDEFDREQPHIAKVSETDYEVNGRVLLEDVAELLALKLDGEGIATIGGYIFTRLGRKPKKGDELEFDGYVFQVLEVAGFRIMKVRLSKKTTTEQD
jgi:CBS domain containing-hemolysin-like protein